MTSTLPHFIALSKTRSADATTLDVLSAISENSKAALARSLFFADTFGFHLPEALVTAAVAFTRAGYPEKGLLLWDELTKNRELSTLWIEKAVQNAFGSEKASTWLKLLSATFLSHPSVNFLQLLDRQNCPLTGSMGIHEGQFRAWLWIPTKEKFRIVVSKGAPALSVSTFSSNYSIGKTLHTLTAKLPLSDTPYTISLTTDGNGHIENSPLLVSSCGCARGKKRKKAAVTVLLPVYGDRTTTLTCLASLFVSQKHIRTGHRILVVWDHGPDERLLADLRRLAARGKIELVENPVNLGFLGSVNAGLASASLGDVILLNADTIVCGDWLDRMAEAMKKKDLATVTVLSNNAELLSYPDYHKRAVIRKYSHVRGLDSAASKIPPDLALHRIPVGTGFCMGIARRALDACAGLDGLFLFNGYGEEVDFCLRAEQHGLYNYALLSVFVAHVGSRSFGARKRALVVQNNKAIFAKYPRYDRDYTCFLNSDPLHRAKESLTCFWLERQGPLTAVHLRPWVEQFLPPFPPQESVSLTLHARQNGERVSLALAIAGPFAMPVIPFTLPSDAERLGTLLRKLGCTRAIAPATDFFRGLAARLGLAHEEPAPFADIPATPETIESIYGVFPPLTLAEWKKLVDLAASLPETLFQVLGLREIWGRPVAPLNIQPLPKRYGKKIVYPEAILVPEPRDAVLWQREKTWLLATVPNTPLVHLDALLTFVKEKLLREKTDA